RLERYLQQLPPDITRPRHARRQAQRDLQSLNDRGDRGIACSAVRPQAGTDVRTPTAQATPMPEGRSRPCRVRLISRHLSQATGVIRIRRLSPPNRVFKISFNPANLIASTPILT